jgi:AraC-like DNA-binding protein
MPLAERSARIQGSPAGPSAQGWVLSHIIRWVESQGADAGAIRRLLSGAGDIADPDLRVPEATMAAAWRLAAESMRDDALGIHVAESLPRGAFDLVEYAVRASPSLAVGLERLARYGRLISDRAAARVEIHAGGLMLLIRDLGAGPLHPARAEFALAIALKTARECAGDGIAPLQVSCAHPAPADVTEHRRFFRVPVRFGSGANSMTFSPADTSRRMQDADDTLSAIVWRRLDKAIAAGEQQPGSLVSRVRRLVVENLGRTPLARDGVAHALAVSRRTLSRRLAEEGTTFTAIFDDVRREFACGLLLDQTLSVADIAFFLQYSEPAAFHRSFRRWTNQTPVAFRTAAATIPADRAPR